MRFNFTILVICFYRFMHNHILRLVYLQLKKKMHALYLATVFAGALICLLTSLLLFARRKAGERSRVLLAVIVFFSVFNYLPRFIDLCNGEIPEGVISVKLLLVAYFMVISYILYPLEVISPGWLNAKRLLALYASWLILLGVYISSRFAGVTYGTYASISEMIPYVAQFDVLFRLIICVLIFSPILAVFFLRRSKRYTNSDTVWIRKYVLAFLFNILAYMIVLIFNHPYINILYYYVSVGCSLYIVYMELFDRLIIPTEIMPSDFSVIPEPPKSTSGLHCNTSHSDLIERLNAHIHANKAWRNPDLNLNALASALYTNRTTLAQAMQANGYENYTLYINKLRVDDFLSQMKTGQWDNFQDVFFYVGFRSRATALRNFRRITGKTPSEFFTQHTTEMQD